MRMFGIATRTVASIRKPKGKEQWETFHVPFESKNNVRVSFVFLRNALSSSFGRSAIVFVDMRESRSLKRVQE